MDKQTIQIGTNIATVGSIFIALSIFLMNPNASTVYSNPASYLFAGGLIILLAGFIILIEGVIITQKINYKFDIGTYLILFVGIAFSFFGLLWILKIVLFGP